MGRRKPSARFIYRISGGSDRFRCIRPLSVFLCGCVNSVFLWNEHTTGPSNCAQARAIIATKTKEQKRYHVSNLKMVYENYAYYDLNL